jgi:hypothetical protein
MFVPLENGDSVNGYPPNVWQSWSQAKQEEEGIFSYIPFTPLPGMKSAGTNRRFQRVNDVVREAFDVIMVQSRR